MKNFIHDDFLLETDFAKELYHDYAKNQPIIDYHSHLPVNEIAANKNFANLTQVWIKGDHYKWRAMRALGIEEKYITGNATDEEKFHKWAETVPYTLRNPLYHWTHMELSRYFGVDQILSPKTAAEVYAICNEKLKQPDFTPQNLLYRMNAEAACTTDDPLDDLSEHAHLSNIDYSVSVLPTFRPDGLINIESGDFNDYLSRLSIITDITITDFESLKEAIRTRIDFFHAHGCRLSDHGLPHAFSEAYSLKQVNDILKLRLEGKSVTEKEEVQYKTAIMHALGELYAEKNWVMQLHLGPIRDTNQAVLNQVGINAGVDSIGDYQQAETLAGFLNHLNNSDKLPKTIIYNSNPSDNEVFATMAGNFSGEGIKSKVQFGAAWWFLDQKDGIEDQLNVLSNMGLLSCSVGMLTDSRSFLSFPRHEYYRRVLCNMLGNDLKSGLLPHDMEWIGQIVKDITYNNAKAFFQFPSKVKKPKIKH